MLHCFQFRFGKSHSRNPTSKLKVTIKNCLFLKKFCAAERTATFFVRVKTISDMEVVNSVQNNTQTGERLTVEKVGSILMISRHLDNAGSVGLAARKEEALGWQFTKQKRRLVLRQKF